MHTLQNQSDLHLSLCITNTEWSLRPAYNEEFTYTCITVSLVKKFANVGTARIHIPAQVTKNPRSFNSFTTLLAKKSAIPTQTAQRPFSLHVKSCFYKKFPPPPPKINQPKNKNQKAPVTFNFFTRNTAVTCIKTWNF